MIKPYTVLVESYIDLVRSNRSNSSNICQRTKHENIAPRGLLQPLWVPERIWSHITMDFIEGLHLSQGYSIIYVAVDRLSNYAQFIPLSHPYTTFKVVLTFYDSCI